ncbi:hypothetical protein NQ317_014917, partial [Molorchus minor]
MGASMGKNASLLDALPSGQGTLHVVMLGLDSAGKTTALYRLKFDQYLNTVPTIGFNCEKVKGMIGKAKGIYFYCHKMWYQLLGVGRRRPRETSPLWKSYTRCTDGIVFVLDSVDVERMEEAKMELIRTVKSPENSGVPILVLANKQDLPGAREPRELEKLLGLIELGQGGAPGGHPLARPTRLRYHGRRSARGAGSIVRNDIKEEKISERKEEEGKIRVRCCEIVLSVVNSNVLIA